MGAEAAVVTEGSRTGPPPVGNPAARPRGRRKFYGDFIAIANFVGRKLWCFIFRAMIAHGARSPPAALVEDGMRWAASMHLYTQTFRRQNKNTGSS